MVIVNVDCRERSFRGVLEAADDRGLTLSQPHLLEPRTVALDGTVIISADVVLWVQVID